MFVIRVHPPLICVHHFLVVVVSGTPGPAGEDAGTGREAAASRTVHADEPSGAQRPRRAAAAGPSPAPVSVSICVHLWFRPFELARAWLVRNTFPSLGLCRCSGRNLRGKTTFSRLGVQRNRAAN